MRILHVPFGFYPDAIGGTEVYVESLARALQPHAIEAIIAAPGEHTAAYEYNGLPVRRFRVSAGVADLREMYGEGDVAAAQQFGEILEEEQPDIVHLHAFTRGVSLRTVREAAQRGLPVVFTYHTPTVSCQRGTLLRWGTEICDGRLDVHACAACTLHGKGMSKGASRTLAALPRVMGNIVGRAGLSGGGWTALRMSGLVRSRHAALIAMLAEVDHIVVLCQWTRDLLRLNGVPNKKVTVSPHGLSGDVSAHDPHLHRLPVDEPLLRLAFLGRLDPTKGVDTLIRALRLLPRLPITLDLYGIAQDPGGHAYLRQLRALAMGDPRVVFRIPLARAQIVSQLQQYHLLAVPSRCVETGPLVVLEAFAAGVPVLGSRLGGIAELVTHEVNGLLVDSDSVPEWAAAMRRLSADRALLARLRTGVPAPRTMTNVASEMAALYRSLSPDHIEISAHASI